MFNRQEQLALLLLAGGLLAGSAVALYDYCRPSSLEEFQVVARAEEPPAATTAPAPPAGPVVVHLNTATAAELERLPGIGPKIAARILQLRQERGPLRRLGDLEQVRGIGPRTIERLRPLVAID